MDALKKYEGPTAGFPMLLSEFSTSAGAVLQLQIPTVPGRSKKIPDAKGNGAGEVEVLEKSR